MGSDFIKDSHVAGAWEGQANFNLCMSDYSDTSSGGTQQGSEA